MPKLNFAGVEDQKDFTPLPAGVYTVELVNATEATIKNGANAGATRYALTWEVRDDSDPKIDGRKVWDNQMFTEKAMFRVKGMLKAYGFEVPDTDDAEDVEFEYDDLLGVPIKVRLKVTNASKDPETGREYPAKNEIQKYIVPGADDDEE
jgi:hypothetical protein